MSERVDRFEIAQGAFVVSSRGSARDRSALRREVEALAARIRSKRSGSAAPEVRPSPKVKTKQAMRVIVRVVTAPGYEAKVIGKDPFKAKRPSRSRKVTVPTKRGR